MSKLWLQLENISKEAHAHSRLRRLSAAFGMSTVQTGRGVDDCPSFSTENYTENYILSGLPTGKPQTQQKI
jgi:hypothetical protein